MAKGKKTGGRRKGSLNKTTVTVKQALNEAFKRIGDVRAFAAWARKNKTEFYKLWSKMLPQEITGPDGGAVQVQIIRVLRPPSAKPLDANGFIERQSLNASPSTNGDR